jgi:phosphoglycerate kinase
MAVTWIDDEKLDVEGKRVFVRVDFNVPQDEQGNVTDDERIHAAMPTLKLLAKKGARIILASHLGRPKGKVKKEFSLEPIAPVVQAMLRTQGVAEELIFTDDCVGDGVRALSRDLKPGQVLLLENLRFHSGEEKNDEGFSRQLAECCDVYVNDAFGTAHRAHASTAGMAAFVTTKAGGLLMRKEVEALGGLMKSPKRPFVAILGGAKVSDKLAVLSQLMNKVDRMLIGGAMAYTFLKAMGERTGKSRVEEDRLEIARSIMARAKEKGVELLLPIDHLVGASFAEDTPSRIIKADLFTDDDMGLDIGPETEKLYAAAIKDAGTVFWNGPMGVFEWERFAGGTNAVMRAVTSSKGYTVVGGGDSVAALNQAKMGDKVSHVSTGGGASLELLEGQHLPGLVALGYTF